MGEQRHNRRKNKKIDTKIAAQIALVCIIAPFFIYLGYRLAANCVRLQSYGEEIITIIAFFSNFKIMKVKEKYVKFKKLLGAIVILIWIFIFSFIITYILSILFSKEVEGTESAQTANAPVQDLNKFIDEASFEAKPLIYSEDVLFKDLTYYIDGQKITKDNMVLSIQAVIGRGMNDDLPDRYEDDPDVLNVGLYAESTKDANEYFECYKAIKKRDIEEEDKLYFLRKARDKRKSADGEYVTISNSQNLISDCVGMRELLYLCINKEDDEAKKQELKDEAKECNRDIMCAAWNILHIQYSLHNKSVDEDVLEKLIDAYRWERDHMPEKGTDDDDYDEIIHAFQDYFM